MIDKRLKKYADLIVKIGINVQKNQMVVINAAVECVEFVRLLVESAYQAGASYVSIKWHDDEINKTYYTYADDEIISDVPHYVVEEYKFLVENKAARISIASPTPGLMKDVDPRKLQLSSKASNEHLGFFRKHVMENGAQWCVVAYPTKVWAKHVFKDMDEDEAYNKLLDAILTSSRVTEDNDPILEWEKHMDTLAKHNQMLNDYNFKSLRFKNSLGTDLEVGLVEDHIWGGGGEMSKNDVYFAPNIPTEETFTMPHNKQINGKVYSSKPLNYQGKLIEDFYLEFKDGKVVNYDSRTELETLKSILELDEGSSSLGEVALISHDSPISNTNILFLNTLFDENASCHLALGNAYATNIKDSSKYSEEELISKGYNKSMVHIDFMFGSKDMEVIGIKYDGTTVQIFKNGNFVF